MTKAIYQLFGDSVQVRTLALIIKLFDLVSIKN